MKIESILKKQKERVVISKTELEEIERKAKEFCRSIERKIREKKIKADVFIGGSLAKKTLLKKEKYDVDIFVRFSKEYKDEELAEKLSTLIENAERVHGSRDYFNLKDKEVIFEIIPIIKITKPKEMRNVTDLSYFHVDYITKKIKSNTNLPGEIVLAKSFCRANNCYGAESYIKGFSGYALELLIVHYKSFLNFIKAAAKSKGQIIIDPEKHYKNKEDILTNLNEAKLTSPVVFVDPTFKERNAVAALSSETFLRFKETCKKFLKNPNDGFFEMKKIDSDGMKRMAGKKKAEFFIIKVHTEKQEGDIAGSKLLKFYHFINDKIEKNFEILRKEFFYNEEKEASLFFILKRRKDIIISGPPIKMKEAVERFKKEHKSIVIKNKRVYAKEKNYNSFLEFFSDFKNKKDREMREMGIDELNLL
ncbi:nucleotidyltransferase domain-containing protein [Candidatus Pacearchaeota archaeon]|nr:nucleotidyltransferase domain-containing protein [Candidatus Pacearchaeota archaeon]